MNERQPAHIAMFSIAAPGHVNPSLEVVRELVARGHRVSYAIPASFADRVAATGARPVVYTSTLPTEDDPDAWGTELIDNIEPFLHDAEQVLPQLADAFQGDEPDLVIHDITAYPAPVLAHRWGVPSVSLWPNLVPWEGYEEEVAAPMFAELKESERGRAYYARFRAWLAGNGLPGTDPDHLVGRPRRGIVLIPRVLQPYADRVDESVFTFVGACQGPRSEQPEWERPPGAEKVLLVSLGSSFTKVPEFYRQCLKAFGELPGWHLVLQIGKHVDPEELGEIPADAEVHRWVSQLSILRQADAFITHAGAGGSQEGLATATPMVAVPQAVDQFGNADMLVGLGVARRLDSATATAAELRDAVLGLVGDPAVARELARIGGEMAREGGTRQAADLIEAELPPRTG
ncbi:macrolide-inactivating glycosyltransferase [Streptomyces clavuligerus]|uniref:Oleandomycin glycosyltransferase n=1 Tax=Streptomyces clavuligerus TaxID=1901 RepID=E2PVX0_STRCL|nr:macrolide-inactivating glycosyltransferase [Streptomyces clavuligerus]ANW17537.1 glycosyl transferase [Streptomyces clavuligerus]AXU12082.1 macrolide-inactivating glycosyltransferase [Streptomyces clavuligerus]EFG09960.1 Oleandomycin glycosyltransferase [Streptomyces clavuligerus]MBY6301944.1 macrolide-inactivating glycosyltransferase [Streptomyces clavuligerus]QCS04863.1 macrolide-inactivating glycosyltransferase [Streptomyces clavuligerus]